MLDQGKLKIQGTLAELHYIPGEHLDFLDRSVYPESRSKVPHMLS